MARKAKGLEAALVDHRMIRLAALEPGDTREFEVEVAGLAALLVAKLHKLAEREATSERWAAKDGLDVLRILRGADLQQVAETLLDLETHVVAGRRFCPNADPRPREGGARAGSRRCWRILRATSSLSPTQGTPRKGLWPVFEAQSMTAMRRMGPWQRGQQRTSIA